MKLDFLATTAIATITLLIPLGLTHSAKAQPCDEMLSIRDVVIFCQSKSDQNSEDYDDINQIYQEVLGREADSQGLTTWLNALNRNTRLKEIRSRIAKSRETKGVINRIYQEVLGRNVDPSGLKTYTNHLARGWSQDEVREHIQRSDEANKRNLILSNSVKPATLGGIIYTECQALSQDIR
ncbi:MAG TPA: hypothetical protein DCE56_42090 [Cyanobacteria bacterium UBA8553]|nr:hypothetical protein [Cyanobacteria bacterium UBA8553]HAJ61663.1 hypothetical protein [Cyanobacteria bacterium UBA8543]